MAKETDPHSGRFADDDGDDGAGWLAQFIAEEDGQDRNTLWRLGSWGIAAVGALTLAVMTGQFSSEAARPPQTASVDLARQTQRAEKLAEATQAEARRLLAAVETLNTDRDRLFGRLNAIEQNLDSVTGSIARQDNRPAPPTWPQASEPVQPSPAIPVVAKPETTAATEPAPATPAPAPPTGSRETSAAVPPPERTAEAPAATERPSAVVVAAIPPVREAAVAPARAVEAVAEPNPAAVAATSPAADKLPDLPISQTEFGLDIGGANSVAGLRALWRGARKANPAELADLRPILVVKERNNGLGLQLRLVAGPIRDAAAAAKICAIFAARERDCEPALFDGQRLSMQSDQPSAPRQPAPQPRPAKRKDAPQAEAPPPQPAPAPVAESSILPSFLRPR